MLRPTVPCTPIPGATCRPIAAGNYEQAYWIARTRNPLASICGRVCAAPVSWPAGGMDRRGGLHSRAQAVCHRTLRRGNPAGQGALCPGRCREDQQVRRRRIPAVAYGGKTAKPRLHRRRGTGGTRLRTSLPCWDMRPYLRDGEGGGRDVRRGYSCVPASPGAPPEPRSTRSRRSASDQAGSPARQRTSRSKAVVR